MGKVAQGSVGLLAGQRGRGRGKGASGEGVCEEEGQGGGNAGTKGVP